MGGLALIARELGWQVEGCDENVYPPMSDLLQAQGIVVHPGYQPEYLEPAPDVVVVGNVLSRGNPAAEAMLNRRLNFISGPQWLGEQLLARRTVLAVAGTHGKTTTTSMLAWILEDNGLQPGFLVGGVPENFGLSARAGRGDHFVIEADEYDTAFFDKRSKFVHYRPEVLVLNNLEFDHADIFEDLGEIQRQFHHLIRTVPGRGQIVCNGEDRNLDQMLKMGCWTPLTRFSACPQNSEEWRCEVETRDGSSFKVIHQNRHVGSVNWPFLGEHNLNNALAAIAAAAAVGIDPAAAASSLCSFGGVKRRMELLGEIDGTRIFDDFAHHPTAIKTTLEGARAAQRGGRLIAVLEPRSNSMRAGVHTKQVAPALAAADRAHIYVPASLHWNAQQVLDQLSIPGLLHDDVDEMVQAIAGQLEPGDQVVFMSNGSFEGAPRRLLSMLQESVS